MGVADHYKDDLIGLEMPIASTCSLSVEIILYGTDADMLTDQNAH